MLPIVEMFYSIQGEGEKMGYPSVFVRLGGCNLSCKGFGCKTISPKTGEELIGCDSIRAVNSKHFKETWDYYKNWKNLVKAIEKYIPNNYQKPLIIFTGGEPLLYKDNEILIDTLQYFISRGYEIWFETNGTILPDFEKMKYIKNVILLFHQNLRIVVNQKKKDINQKLLIKF
jgi:6-pyruvoyltetrahydropterin 2'-reductase